MRGSRTTLTFARATFDQNRFVTLSRVSIAGGLHGESEDLLLFKTTYAVGAGEVLLTVVIGEKQLGTSLARIGDKVLAKGAIKKLKVGKGPGLAGSKLTMKSVVTDSNDMTNRTSITIMLEGGTAPAKHTLAIEVDEQGDSAIYRSEVWSSWHEPPLFRAGRYAVGRRAGGCGPGTHRGQVRGSSNPCIG